MWIFTRYGFFSIACADKPDGSLDSQSVMVRARCIGHLCSLQKRFPALQSAGLLNCRIMTIAIGWLCRRHLGARLLVNWPKSKIGRTSNMRPRDTREILADDTSGHCTMYGL
jgi:hypothetical protein